MEYNLFKQQVLERLNVGIGNKSKVKIEQISKNNSIILDVVQIVKDGEVVSPCIYLKPYYMEYVQGKGIETIISEIIETYNVAMMQNERNNIEKIQLSSFEIIKERVFVKLINAQLNEELLITIPHKRYLDLVVIYCLLCNETEEGISSITINNKLFEQWDCSLQELHDVALCNTENMFPAQIKSMNDIIYEMTGADLSILDNGEQSPTMYVMTNLMGINGASTLVYPNIINSIVKSIGGNVDKILVLPSSIHELILVPISDGDYSVTGLRQMVKEVNQTQVAKGEILSCNVYYILPDKKYFNIL